MVRIKFWSKSNHRFLETEFTEEQWKTIVESCKKAGIPLNCEILK